MEQSLESALTALRLNHFSESANLNIFLDLLMSLSLSLKVVPSSHNSLQSFIGEQGNFTSTDMKIARKCHDEGRALVICANKRDVVAQFGVSARQYEKVCLFACFLV